MIWVDQPKTPWLWVQKPVRCYLGTLERLEGTKDWWMEAKIDGWRCLIRFDSNREPSLWTRQGNLIIEAPGGIPNNLRTQLHGLSKQVKPYTVLDAEFYNPEKRGSWAKHPEVKCKLEIFDIIYDNGDYSGVHTQIIRRRVLENLVEQSEDIKLAKILPVTLVSYSAVHYLATKTDFVSTVKVRPESNWTGGFIHGVVLKQLEGKRGDSTGETSREVNAWMKITLPKQSVWNP